MGQHIPNKIPLHKFAWRHWILADVNSFEGRQQTFRQKWWFPVLPGILFKTEPRTAWASLTTHFVQKTMRNMIAIMITANFGRCPSRYGPPRIMTTGRYPLANFVHWSVFPGQNTLADNDQGRRYGPTNITYTGHYPQTNYRISPQISPEHTLFVLIFAKLIRAKLILVGLVFTIL